MDITHEKIIIHSTHYYVIIVSVDCIIYNLKALFIVHTNIHKLYWNNLPHYGDIRKSLLWKTDFSFFYTFLVKFYHSLKIAINTVALIELIILK